MSDEGPQKSEHILPYSEPTGLEKMRTLATALGSIGELELVPKKNIEGAPDLNLESVIQEIREIPWKETEIPNMYIAEDPNTSEAKWQGTITDFSCDISNNGYPSENELQAIKIEVELESNKVVVEIISTNSKYDYSLDY